MKLSIKSNLAKWAILISLGFVYPVNSYTQPHFQGLSLGDIERIALDRDTLIKSFEQKAGAFKEQSTAVDTWPDPRLKFGAQAVPVDSFELDQEPMTQVIIGYQQMLPRGNSNQIASESMQAMSRLQQANKQQRIREVLMQVRKAWFDVVLQIESVRIIQANRQLFVKMLDISQSHYASGLQQQQDVVQAELDLSLVDDRLEQANSDLLVARANLSKWIGEHTLNDDLYLDVNKLNIQKFPSKAELMPRLLTNPKIIAVQEAVFGQLKKVEMTNEEYSPQWGFDINYGKRDGNNPDGSERGNFLTAMVTLDLPLFTENKQDRNLAAEKQRLQATRYQKIDIERLLIKRLEQTMARLDKLKKRNQLYENKVLLQAHQNAEIALKGYQSGVVNFFTLSRARVAELNTRLADLKISIDYNKNFAELEFLVGEL